MMLSSAVVDFYVFYEGAVDTQRWGLLTRSQCIVSNTHMTVKAFGPLVIVLRSRRQSSDFKGMYSKIVFMWWQRQISLNSINNTRL